jgi:hypothetical protein
MLSHVECNIIRERDCHMLEIINNNLTIFKLTISKNNIISGYQFYNHTSNHEFKDDYNYELDRLMDWEQHGKLIQESFNKLKSDNCVYKFYYVNKILDISFRNNNGFLTIEHNEFPDDFSLVDVYTSHIIQFDKESSTMILDQLSEFCFPVK